LLRAQLRAGLQRRRPDLAAAAHGRAARWLAETGELDLALNHAHHADDPDLVIGLLHEHGAELATSGLHVAVGRALDALPPGWQRRDPQLALVAALANLESGRLDAARRLLDEADATRPTEAATTLQSTRELIRARRAWFRTSSDEGGPGPVRNPANGPDSDVGASLMQVDAALAAGEVHRAGALARTATEHAQRAGNAYLVARATASQAVCAGLLGDYPRMVVLATRSMELAPASGWRGTLSYAYTQLMLAYGALLHAQPGTALSLLDETDEAGREEGNLEELHRLVPELEAVRNAARFDLGEHRAALRAMRVHRMAATAGPPLAPGSKALIALLEHGAAVQLGWREEARAVLAWAEEHLGPTGDLLYLRACGPAAISRYDIARDHLLPLLDGTVAPAVRWLPIAGWVLEAAALRHAGRRPAARRAAAQALALAGRMGVLRPLVRASDDVAELIAEHRGEGREVARQALALRSRAARGPSTPLTGREREVLDMLPTMLSLEEIAEAMAVSLNTVKTHIRGIYAKLGVSTRRDSVDAARRTGLLDPDPATTRGRFR
jgi:LuxR family maltose regulon positive regulatory protein